MLGCGCDFSRIDCKFSRIDYSRSSSPFRDPLVCGVPANVISPLVTIELRLGKLSIQHPYGALYPLSIIMYYYYNYSKFRDPRLSKTYRHDIGHLMLVWGPCPFLTRVL